MRESGVRTSPDAPYAGLVSAASTSAFQAERAGSNPVSCSSSHWGKPAPFCVAKLKTDWVRVTAPVGYREQAKVWFRVPLNQKSSATGRRNMLVRPFLIRTWSGGTILVEEWCSWVLYADVLQLVEGSTDNRVVAGSSPAIRTSRASLLYKASRSEKFFVGQINKDHEGLAHLGCLPFGYKRGQEVCQIHLSVENGSKVIQLKGQDATLDIGD